MLLAELIELFIDDVCAGKQNETAQAYRTKLRQLQKYLDSKPITHETIKGFLHDAKTRKRHRRGYRIVEGGLSPYTIKTIFQTVRHFCRWLYDNGHLDQDLARHIAIPYPPPPAPKAITNDDVMKMIHTANTQTHEQWERVRDVAIMYYLRDTGGRVGGMCELRLSGCDLTDGSIETIEKSRNVKLYINPPTISAIREWLKWRAQLKPITDHLFISNRTKQGMTRQGVHRMLQRNADRAGVQGRINPHAWRHAFARDFLKNGGEISQLAGLMNHSSIWVTNNYYARWNDDELRNAHAESSPINALQTTEA